MMRDPQEETRAGSATRRVLRPWLVLSMVFFAVVSVAGRSSGDVVRLKIESTPGLERYSSRLAAWDPARMERFATLLGVDEDGEVPIRVVLASEDSAAELGAPGWVAGYALGGSATVVLFPSRVPVYPYRSLEELLGHEVAHVLIHRASEGRPLPRWFHEGLSMLAEEAWGWEDRSRVALSVLRQGRYDLARLDRRFGRPEDVAQAYALSGAFVRDLVNRNGHDFPADLLAAVASGTDFQVAFESATGRSLAEAEDSFWRRFTFWYRWLPFLTSSTVLWIAIVFLALLAGRRRRQRVQALKERWELEEAWVEASTVDPDSSGPVN